MKDLSPEVVDSVVALGKLSLDFSAIMRATAKEDGVTEESDTDHTVMLGLVACAFAAATKPELDLGKVAQFALVHDLVEVYAGDTNTFGAHYTKPDEDKEQREREALARIHHEFDASLPWIAHMIDEYESLASPEARFIKTIDKVLPKITHIVNGGKRLQNHFGVPEFAPHAKRQREHLAQTAGHDQIEALALYDAVVERVKAIL